MVVLHAAALLQHPKEPADDVNALSIRVAVQRMVLVCYRRNEGVFTMASKLSSILVASLLLWGTPKMVAASAPPDAATSQVIRVLVGVNSDGKVFTASPADPLSPAIERTLRHTLARAITKPAHDAEGNPITSSFVMKLALQTVRNANGDYNVKSSYVSVKALPPGSWLWCQAHGKTYLVNVAKRGVTCPAPQRRLFWPIYESSPQI